MKPPGDECLHRPALYDGKPRGKTPPAVGCYGAAISGRIILAMPGASAWGMEASRRYVAGRLGRNAGSRGAAAGSGKRSGERKWKTA